MSSYYMDDRSGVANDRDRDSNTCAICRSAMSSRDALTKLACGHVLHRGCAKVCVSTGFKCPYCGKSLMTRYSNL
ncbi:unnamed protein product [Calicophoron daubneyi]|uniref:RING-type domain-containing protein n=1 Tax=Calicophoron daubneyi TaxID=300641 RepID=A0AAV2TFM5_CALDB